MIEGDDVLKIMVVGSSGSGKSTLSRMLSKVLDIPLYHLDALFWQPNWVLMSREARASIQGLLIQKPAWIMDGGYRDIIDARIDEADVIIFLAVQRYVCLYRVFKRLFENLGRTRIDMGKDCKEKIDVPFLKYIWSYPKRVKPDILNRIFADTNKRKVIVLNGRKEVQWFKSQLNNTSFVDNVE